MSVRRRYSAAAATLLAGALFVASEVPASAAETTIQATGEATTPEWSEAQGANILDAAGRKGAGYEVSASAGPGYAQWSNDLIQDAPYWSVRAWVQVKEVGAKESVDLLTIRNSNGVDNFDFFLGASRERFRWDIVGEQPGRSIAEVGLNEWYLVEAYGDFEGTSHSATVRINGEPQGTLTSTGQKAASVLSFWLGTSVPKTHRQWYDDVAMRVSDSPLTYLGALPTPKAVPKPASSSARPTQSATSAATPSASAAGVAGAQEAASDSGTSRGLVWVGVCVVVLAGLGLAWFMSRRREADEVF